MRRIFFFLFLLFSLSLPLNAEAQYTPDSVYTAARAGQLEKVQAKLGKTKNQTILNNTLGAAVVGNRPEIIKFLVQRGADPNHLSSFNSPLLNNAIMYGFAESALALIDAGANVEMRGFRRIAYNLTIEYNWTPLMCAAWTGNEKIVQSLLDHGADPTEKGWSTGPDDIETSADVAAYAGHLNILKLLLKKGVPISPATIFKTVRGGHLDTLKYLLKKDKDINLIGPYHKTLLMEASWWGYPEIVKYLLRKGADVKQVGDDGQTALIAVVSNTGLRQKTQYEIAQLLIRKGINVNARGKNNLTALQLAERYNHKDLIQLLEKSGAKN